MVPALEKVEAQIESDAWSNTFIYLELSICTCMLSLFGTWVFWAIDKGAGHWS